MPVYLWFIHRKSLAAAPKGTPKCGLLQAKADDGGAKKKKGSAKQPTLGTQFKRQLQSLMKTLNSTFPHFVRCMKPNAEKSGGIFTSQMMMAQLRYAGLLEVCRIRQIGYPVRKTFDDFVFRYRCLDLANAQDHVKLTNALAAKGLLEDQQWQIGHTKVFMRNAQQTKLEEAREDALKGVVRKIQAQVRRFLCRCRYVQWKQYMQALRSATEARDEAAVSLIENAGYLSSPSHFVCAARRGIDKRT